MAQIQYTDKADLILTLTQVKSKIDGYLENYVAKESGKGLSTNDLTDAMVTAINSIASKATIASPEFTGIPKAPNAVLGDNSTQIATTSFVATAIANALATITGVKFEKVDSLPETGILGTIYLLTNGGGDPNVYDEYFWTGAEFELFGTTALDLSGYVQYTDLVAIPEADITAMFSAW